MLQPENKRNLAPTKNSVPNEASQRTVFFEGLNKEQYPKTDISAIPVVLIPRTISVLANRVCDVTAMQRNSLAGLVNDC